MADTIRLSALADLAAPTPATAGSGIRLQQRHPLSMLNLRGIADSALRDAVRSVCGCELPVAPNSSSSCPTGDILKLGPNEWLLVATPEKPWSETMAVPGATLTDISHARVAVLVDGDKSRDMLMKGCAIDLHPRQFPPGTCIQTTIAKIGVILHKLPNDSGFMLYAARSYAGSIWHWLTSAANEYGYDVVTPHANNNVHRG